MATDYIGCLAKEIAVSSQGWDSIGILTDEDAVDRAKILFGTIIRAIRWLKEASRSVADAVYTQEGSKGIYPSIALRNLLEPEIEPPPRCSAVVGVDIPAAAERLPCLKNSVRLPSPTSGMVNSRPKEPAEAQNASPSYSAYCDSNSANLPWIIDEPSNTRSWGDMRARRAR